MKDFQDKHKLSSEPYAVLDVVTSGSDPDRDDVVEIAVVCFQNCSITDADDGSILPSYYGPSRQAPLSPMDGLLHRLRRDAALEPFLSTAYASVGVLDMIAYDADRMGQFVRTKRALYCCRSAVSAVYGGTTAHDVDRDRLKITNAYRRAVFVGAVFHEVLRSVEIAQPQRLRDFLLRLNRAPGTDAEGPS